MVDDSDAETAAAIDVADEQLYAETLFRQFYNPTFYALLNLPETCSPVEMHRALKQFLRRRHPDKLIAGEDATLARDVVTMENFLKKPQLKVRPKSSYSYNPNRFTYNQKS